VSSDFYTLSILPHAGIIIKICRAYTDNDADFDDYYQEVCLQIWRSKDNFKAESEWSTWIYRLTLNVCLTLLKKTKKKKHFFSAEHHVVDVPEESQTEFSDEALAQLYIAIRQLSEIDRAVILLYLDEKSYREISEIIGTSANNIGVRINRIKERLKKLLDGKVN
jgi:RNA polymerase sigma-70 factor (ECF subfamily)